MAGRERRAWAAVGLGFVFGVLCLVFRVHDLVFRVGIFGCWEHTWTRMSEQSSLEHDCDGATQEIDESVMNLRVQV